MERILLKKGMEGTAVDQSLTQIREAFYNNHSSNSNNRSQKYGSFSFRFGLFF